MIVSMDSKTVYSIYEDNFTSVFSPYILRFLEIKASAEYKLDNFLAVLRDFDRFISKSEITSLYLPQSVLAAWKDQTTGIKASTIYEKCCIMGQFCRYLIKLGIPCHMPVYPRKPKKLYVPYIFSKEEIEKIFFAADSLKAENRLFTSAVFSIPVILRLLYSTGMRIGEALALNNKDVDMPNGVIYIRHPKNKMERQLPIIDSLHCVLRQYLENRGKLPLQCVGLPDNPLFISLNGSRIDNGAVFRWFLRILQICGIPYMPGKGPRIHDLRHTFAVRALEWASRDGADLYNTLPVISVALGHKCVTDTEHYVRITRQVYPDLTAMTSAISEHIFPTISIPRQ